MILIRNCTFTVLFRISCRISKNVSRHFLWFSCVLTRTSHARDSVWFVKKRYQTIVTVTIRPNKRLKKETTTSKQTVPSLTLKLSSFIHSTQERSQSQWIWMHGAPVSTILNSFIFLVMINCWWRKKSHSKQTDESFIFDSVCVDYWVHFMCRWCY